jgi:Cu-processing system permease protein
MAERLRRIFALARLIMVDGLRRQAMIGLMLFALAAIVSGMFFFHFIPRDVGRAAGDFLFSITWLTGIIFLLFHTVQVAAWNSERGSLHGFMARPISRSEYVLGLFVGMALLLLAIHLVLGGLNWLILGSIRQAVASDHFQVLSLGYFLLAGVGLYWLHLMLLAVILFFSSAVRGSFPVLLLALCYSCICSGLPVVRESLREGDLPAAGLSTAVVLKGLAAFFPDSAWLDFKSLATTTDLAPTAVQVGTAFALSSLYLGIVLWLACIIYQRRDLQ